jgi:hypothetical protein
MTKGIEFAEQGIKLYEQKIKERQMKYLQKHPESFRDRSYAYSSTTSLSSLAGAGYTHYII